MSDMGLNSSVEEAFDSLDRCNKILDTYGMRSLEAALGVNVGALDGDHSHDELEFSISEDLYFNDKCWASSDHDCHEIRPPYFWDLVSVALHLLLQNLYWARLWIVQELAVSSSAH